MRLNRFLAAAGLGSRRSCEELIIAGRVTINGRVCQNLATEVEEEDFVKLGSKRVLPEKPLYILLHKPRGFLATASDTHDRRTIFELLPAHWPRVFHVGRLDRESEGLLIMTNDGDLALHLTHPRYKIEKEYEVTLDQPFKAAEDAPKLLKGIHIEGGRAQAESVKQLSPVSVRVVLRQGLKRQIRLMFYKLGYEVKALVRTRIGPLRMGDLRPGEWRFLTAPEVKSLQAKPAAKAALPGPAKRDEAPRREARRGEAARPDGKRPQAARGTGGKRPGPARRGARPPSAGPSARRSASSAPRRAGRP